MIDFLYLLIYFFWLSSTLILEGVPYDGVPLVEVVLESLSLSVVFGTIGTFGILFVIFCLTFNIVFRKTK